MAKEGNSHESSCDLSLYTTGSLGVWGKRFGGRGVTDYAVDLGHQSIFSRQDLKEGKCRVKRVVWTSHLLGWQDVSDLIMPLGAFTKCGLQISKSKEIPIYCVLSRYNQ